jgi:hypothetical protein
MVGNSVSPPPAIALIAANAWDLAICTAKRRVNCSSKDIGPWVHYRDAVIGGELGPMIEARRRTVAE